MEDFVRLPPGFNPKSQIQNPKWVAGKARVVSFVSFVVRTVLAHNQSAIGRTYRANSRTGRFTVPHFGLRSRALVS